MDTQCADALFYRYLELFRDRTSLQSCLHRGIECGNGWYDLIDTLCACLEQDADGPKVDSIAIVQIKEKFGGLRVYASNATERQRGMIQLASALSERICECCGAPGRATTIGRLQATRCEAHSATATPGRW